MADCRCRPNSNSVEIIGGGNDKTVLELIQDFKIRKSGKDICVSQTTVYLYSNGIEFLKPGSHSLCILQKNRLYRDSNASHRKVRASNAAV